MTTTSTPQKTALPPPTSKDRGLRELLPQDEWKLLEADCRAYAKRRGVENKFDDLFLKMWVVEADEATSTWDPGKGWSRRTHLYGRFRNMVFSDRVAADNNLAPLGMSPDDPNFRNAAAGDPSPERVAMMGELVGPALEILQRRIAKDDLVQRLVWLEMDGVTKPQEQAEALGLPIGAIEDGRDRLKRHREAAARELGFKGRRDMFAAGLPTKELPKAPGVPARNGAVWTWLFAASWAGGVAACTAGVLRGWSAGLVGAAIAGVVGVAVTWTLWLLATWRAIPPGFLYVNKKLVGRDEAMRLLVRRGSIFAATAGLCEAVDFGATAGTAPARLVRVACWLSVTPAVVVAPLLWFVAMLRIDAPVAKGLREWHDRDARDRARFGTE